jgi:hypothetical protein
MRAITIITAFITIFPFAFQACMNREPVRTNGFLGFSNAIGTFA